jgi:hypothetical protein
MSDDKAAKVAELLADTELMGSPEQEAELAAVELKAAAAIAAGKYLRGMGLRTVGDAGWLDANNEAPPLRALLNVLDDDGKEWPFMPLGTVAMMVAPGGTGKTQALVQLAIAVASGTRWLEKYTVTKPGAVLLALGEEDSDEMHRRIRSAVRAAGWNDTADLTALNLHTIALRGVPAGMVDKDGLDTLFAKQFHSGLDAMGVEWSLIILDPGSRFMGPEAEKDNAQATRFIECLERLTQLPGRPTVLLAHHTTKTALAGNTDQGAARGSSALTDGARWQVNLDRWVEMGPNGAMVGDNDRCKLSVVKANNVARFQTLNLRRVKDKGGYLVPADDQERPVTARPRGSSGGASKAAKAQDKIGGLAGKARSLRDAAGEAAAAVASHKATAQHDPAKLKELERKQQQAERMASKAELDLQAERGAQAGAAPKVDGRSKASEPSGGDDDR